GKITTYRHLAASAVDQLADALPMLRGGDWTGGAPLPGGEFAVNGLPALVAALGREYPFLPAAMVDRVARAYGLLARQWLGNARDFAALGQDFGGGLTGAEVDYLVAQEWACTVDDIIWRRTKTGLMMDDAGRAALARHLDARAIG
ncbi:MAG: glycerol-3-phosphate dehydrogenase C-terminal domain-containing protein, partial [Sphingopyxis sp.]